MFPDDSIELSGQVPHITTQELQYQDITDSLNISNYEDDVLINTSTSDNMDWFNKAFSYSKISTWCTCPRQFKYKYIQKLPTEEKDNTALLKGSAIHSILENYPGKSSHKLADSYQHIVNDFLESDYKTLFNYPNLREVKIAFDIDLNPVPYSNLAFFRGFIDFMCYINDEVHIIDYKSGKYKSPEYQDYNQLLFYAIFIFKKYPGVQLINIRYIYVEHKLENNMKLERKYLDNYINELKNIIHQIKNSTFDKKVGRLCEYCDFKIFCSTDV